MYLAALTVSWYAVADKQYNDMISSPDAWQLSDDAADGSDAERNSADLGTKVTNSARRFRVLIERVSGVSYHIAIS